MRGNKPYLLESEYAMSVVLDRSQPNVIGYCDCKLSLQRGLKLWGNCILTLQIMKLTIIISIITKACKHDPN
jgi:hypothetical protein